MTVEEVLAFLASMERRVATLEDEARQTRDRAQQTLDRLARLRDDLKQAHQALLAQAPGAEKDEDSEEDTPRP
jgi:hypothetical protein